MKQFFQKSFSWVLIQRLLFTYNNCCFSHVHYFILTSIIFNLSLYHPVGQCSKIFLQPCAVSFWLDCPNNCVISKLCQLTAYPHTRSFKSNLVSASALKKLEVDLHSCWQSCVNDDALLLLFISYLLIGCFLIGKKAHFSFENLSALLLNNEPFQSLFLYSDSYFGSIYG